ncbi:hypothetical protein ACMZ5F_00645 [Streptomyces rhizosphaericola]|uniref:hypothetical protein n=1 Tax=Streptomyces rhizosphaericola TaxID=2564098 RepID=UPI0039F09A14
MSKSDFLRYARVHHAAAILAGTGAVVVLSAFFGGVHIGLPSIGSGGVTTGVPFRRELPLMSGVFLAAALKSAMSTHEEMGTQAMHRYRHLYCIGLTVTVCVFSFAVEALSVDAEAGVVFARSLLIWYGLALLSSKLLGDQLGWAVPLASAFPLIWYPQQWWDWTFTSAGDPFSWAFAAFTLSVGAGVNAATAWRRRSWSRR